MKSFVMIDKEEYDSQAHIPKREYEDLLRKSRENSKSLSERAMFLYDRLTDALSSKNKLDGQSVAEWMKSRRPIFIDDCKREFGANP